MRVVAISADTPEEARANCTRLGLTFPFLADPKLEVISRYGLRHAGGGPKRADIARPAEFLIDPAGVVRWVNLTESVTVRTRPEQVLAAFDAMRSNPAPSK